METHVFVHAHKHATLFDIVTSNPLLLTYTHQCVPNPSTHALKHSTHTYTLTGNTVFLMDEGGRETHKQCFKLRLQFEKI